MEGNPPPGEDLLTSRLPSLPPPPQEISPELVSPLSLPGQAPHAEGSADLRVSPLIAVAPRHGTTTSTNQHRSPADAGRLAPAPATSGGPDSSSRAVPPTEPPIGSTSTDNGVCGVGGSTSNLTSTRISTDPRARSSMVTALPPFTQGLTTTLPQGGPSIGQPPHPAPDASGASPDAGEQMVPTLASPVSHRDTADRPDPTHLPTPDQPPLDGTIDPHLQGARAVPPFQEDNIQHLRTCLPAPPSATSSDSTVQNVGIARDAAGSLRGTSAAATGNAGLEAAMASGGSRATQPTVRNPDPSRQSHPPTTHPIAAASLREPLNVGGSEFAAATSNAGLEAAMASGGSRAAQPTLRNPDPSRQSHPPTTHPIAAASLREPLNVGGSELETQNAPLPLPLPQPAGPRNDVLDELTTANTGRLTATSRGFRRPA